MIIINQKTNKARPTIEWKPEGENQEGDQRKDRWIVYDKLRQNSIKVVKPYDNDDEIVMKVSLFILNI